MQQVIELRGNPLELLAVAGGEGGEFVFAPGRQSEADLAVIAGIGIAADIFFPGEAVGEADAAVVLDLQAFGEFADGDMVATGKTLDGEEGLVLLGGEAGGVGGILAEAEEFPQGVAELRQALIMGAGELVFGLHRELLGTGQSGRQIKSA